MGVVNATPDSFYEHVDSVQEGVELGLKFLEQGADIIDVGGESTRPGAMPVPVDA
jgi:dihydropteroate synthase